MKFFLLLAAASLCVSQVAINTAALSREDAAIVHILAEAITPRDSALNKHPFNALSAAYLAAPSDSLASELRAFLVKWKWNHSKYLAPILARQSALGKFSDVSENLEELAVLASQVLDKKQDIVNYTFNDVWRQKAATALQRAKAETAAYKIRPLEGLEKLIRSE